jgi:hypothetical protein
MQRYKQSKTPRTAFGLAAITLTALTFALTVVAPAQTETSAAVAPPALATAHPATPVAIHPGRIDVIGVRAKVLAQDHSAATLGQPG